MDPRVQKTSTQQAQHSDFSIEHILNFAGRKAIKSITDSSSMPNSNLNWLRCTRFCPPKVPRRRAAHSGPVKRQLGRHPRIPFTSSQLSILETHFKVTPYLSSDQVTYLSGILQLADIRIKIWFQNRRARERRELHQECCAKEMGSLRKSPTPTVESDAVPERWVSDSATVTHTPNNGDKQMLPPPKCPELSIDYQRLLNRKQS